MEACGYWASAFNLIVLLKLLLAGYLPLNAPSIHPETIYVWLRRFSLHLSVSVFSLSLTSRLLSLSPRSCMSNLLRMRTGPPLCLYSPLIFSLFFFSTSLPIFMPVPLRQYRFRQTLAPLFHPFFFLLGAFQLYQALCLSFWQNLSGSSLCVADSLFVSLSAFAMHSGYKKEELRRLSLTLFSTPSVGKHLQKKTN